MSRRYIQQLPYSSDGDAQRSRLPNPTFATYSPRSNGSSARMSMGKSAMLCAGSDPGSPAQTYGGDVVANMSEQANGFAGPTYGRDGVQHWPGVSQVHFGGTAAAESLWDASAPGPLGTYTPLGFDLRLDGGQSTQDLGIEAAHNFSFAGQPDQHSYVGATDAHPSTSQAVLHAPSDLAVVDPFLAPAPFAHPSGFPHVVDAVTRAPNHANMGLGDLNCTSIHDHYGRPFTIQSFNHVHPVSSHNSGLAHDIRSHAIDGQYDLYSSSNATSEPILSTNIASVDASDHCTADGGHANHPTAEDTDHVAALINQLFLNEPTHDTVSSVGASPQSVDIAQTPPASVPATPEAEDMAERALCALEAIDLPGRLTVSTMPRRDAAFKRRKVDGSIKCPVFCCNMTFTRLGHLRGETIPSQQFCFEA
ncbi:hypothetical protein FB107DRAFT_289951 [Schizophyllum commune]